MRTLVQMSRDIFIEPYLRSDFDEGHVALPESEADNVDIVRVCNPKARWVEQKSASLDTATTSKLVASTESGLCRDKKEGWPSEGFHEKITGHTPGEVNNKAIHLTDKSKQIRDSAFETFLSNIHRILEKHILLACEDVSAVGDGCVVAGKEVDRVLTEFRPACTDGLTKEQIEFKLELEKQIGMVTTLNPRILALDGITWIYMDKPSFSFVSLATRLGSDMAFDALTATELQITKLWKVDPELFKDLGNATGCEIIVPDPTMEYGIPREIGIKGSKRGVRQCKDAIQEVLDEFSIFKTHFLWD